LPDPGQARRRPLVEPFLRLDGNRASSPPASGRTATGAWGGRGERGGHVRVPAGSGRAAPAAVLFVPLPGASLQRGRLATRTRRKALSGWGWDALPEVLQDAGLLFDIPARDAPASRQAPRPRRPPPESRWSPGCGTTPPCTKPSASCLAAAE